MSIQKNLDKIKKSTTADILIATKYATLSQMALLFETGHTLIGENKVQDAIKKQKALKHFPNISWHFIGHLQKNKVNKAIDHFSCIQSVHSLELAKKINTACEKKKKTMSIFIQINSGNEPNKQGFSFQELKRCQQELFQLPNLSIDGIMVVAPKTDNINYLRSLFRQSKQLFEDLKKAFPTAKNISMGMSNDYQIAIEEGATQIRIGSAIFNN